jgi:hypothetical protein
MTDTSLKNQEAAARGAPGAATRSRSGRRVFGATLLLAAGVFVCSLAVGLSAAAHDSTGAKMPVSLPTLLDVPVADWAALSRKRIFFGHQSVGINILDGVADVMAKHPEIRVDVVKLARPAPIERPALVHEMVGRNGDPSSKIRDFHRLVDQGLGEGVDIAFFKFCYVDFSHASDVDAIFDAYVQSMAGLQKKYPATRFIHATVPLNSLPLSMEQKIKHMAKRFLGRPEVVADNAKRQRFNELLKARFPAEQVFDLALAEAVALDGTLQVDDSGSASPVMMLNTDFTFDGGHLNEIGRRRVAEQLLITLARTAGSN